MAYKVFFCEVAEGTALSIQMTEVWGHAGLASEILTSSPSPKLFLHLPYLNSFKILALFNPKKQPRRKIWVSCFQTGNHQSDIYTCPLLMTCANWSCARTNSSLLGTRTLLQAVLISRLLFPELNNLVKEPKFTNWREMYASLASFLSKAGIRPVLSQKERNTGEKNGYYLCRDLQALNKNTVVQSKTKDKRQTKTQQLRSGSKSFFFFLVETLKLQLTERKQEGGCSSLHLLIASRPLKWGAEQAGSLWGARGISILTSSPWSSRFEIFAVTWAGSRGCPEPGQTNEAWKKCSFTTPPPVVFESHTLRVAEFQLPLE